MTSICNYSHPDLQITTNLSRKGHGTLFPYNPEFYDLTTGLYGPGALICWQLLLLSVILSWAFLSRNRNSSGGGSGSGNGSDNDRRLRPAVSVDLLGVLAYPTFAATDALVHALKMRHAPERALAVFCLRYPEVHLDGFGASFNTTRLDLREGVPADVLELGQRALDLTGPLDVCYMSLAAFHLLAMYACVTHAAESESRLQPTRWAGWLVFGAYCYVVAALWAVHLSLGNVGISMILWFYEIISPLMFVFILVLLAFTAFSFNLVLATLVRGLIGRDKALLLESLKLFGSWLLLASFLAAPVLVNMIMDNPMMFLPDMGISIRERDQLATLIVGIATLLYTLYEVWRRVMQRDSSDDVELQSLTQNQE